MGHGGEWRDQKEGATSGPACRDEGETGRHGRGRQGMQEGPEGRSRPPDGSQRYPTGQGLSRGERGGKVNNSQSLLCRLLPTRGITSETIPGQWEAAQTTLQTKYP